MSRQPILSITFMTPGKKKTLEMCLESIRWMQQDFPCELVIVDTGCDAQHRALIEQYADKIVDFTWINDFAAARNAGIDACSGEWFMIMDDDEVIKDYKPLKDFFESGAYKKYQWIMTMEHDFTDWEESNYEQYYWTRAIRNEPGYRYKGKIHEYLTGTTTPAIAVPAVFGHYGYIFDNDEQRLEHANRNITLLEETLREQPNNIHAATQLAQEYHVIKERKKKEEICKKYYPLAKDAERMNDRSWKDSLYCGWVDAVFAGEDTAEALKLVQRGLTEENLCDEAKTFLYCIGTHLSYRLKKYGECVKNACSYFEFYNKNAREVEVSGAFFFIKTAYDQLQHDLIVQNVLLSAVWLKDEKLFDEYISHLNWEQENLEIHDDIYEVFEEACGDALMRKMAAKLLHQITSVKSLRERVILVMEALEKDYAVLYRELPDVEVILPLIKRTTYERLLTLGMNANLMMKFPEWKRGRIEVKWALSDFLAEDNTTETQNDALERFVEAGELYYPLKYTERALQNKICLSKEAILWKILQSSLGFVHNNQPEEAIRCAKSAMGMDSSYDQALAKWIHGYADSITRQLVGPSEEMLLLGQQVKTQARTLIAQGDCETARSVLQQLQNLLPEDYEIEEILRSI